MVVVSVTAERVVRLVHADADGVASLVARADGALSAVGAATNIHLDVDKIAAARERRFVRVMGRAGARAGA